MVNHTFRALRVAALAIVLMVAGAVVSEAGDINCVTWGPLGQGPSCALSFSSGVPTTNTWNFYTNNSWNTFLYSFSIAGTPNGNFTLDVSDWVATQAYFSPAPPLPTSYPLISFPSLTCIPTFNGIDQCGVFDVMATSGTSAWAPGSDGHNFSIAMVWGTKTPAATPSDYVTILQAKDNLPDLSSNSGRVFTNTLFDIWYYPDPGIGGRGDSFSRFGAFAGSASSLPVATRVDGPVVPEPASLILFGTGLAGLVVRARRRKK